MRRYGFAVIVAAIVVFEASNLQSQAPTRPVSIILPPRLLANAPATLAVLTPDGHLAPGVPVDLGGGQHGVTDAIGELAFTAPSNGALIATASGVSAAALVNDPTHSAAALSVAPAVSQRDRFAVCGSGFQSAAGANHVTINGDPAFILAASPECLVVLPQSRTMPGKVRIVVDASDAALSASTSLVTIDFVPPKPPLEPGSKGRFIVRVDGTNEPVDLLVENRSLDVLHFSRGDTQQVRTSGGSNNQAFVEARAIRSGDFSLKAKILPPPDEASAARFAEIASGIAAGKAQNELKAIASALEKRPHNLAGPGAGLARLADETPAGTLHALIEAARDLLGSRVAGR